MLGVEQTGSGKAVSMFYTEEWNSVLRIDSDKLDFFPSSEVSKGMSGKNRTVYMMQKKVDVHWGIVSRYLWKKLQRVTLALQ